VQTFFLNSYSLKPKTATVCHYCTATSQINSTHTGNKITLRLVLTSLLNTTAWHLLDKAFWFLRRHSITCKISTTIFLHCDSFQSMATGSSQGLMTILRLMDVWKREMYQSEGLARNYKEDETKPQPEVVVSETRTDPTQLTNSGGIISRKGRGQ